MKKKISRSVSTILMAVILVFTAHSQQLSLNTVKAEKTFFESEKRDQPVDVRSTTEVKAKVLNSFNRSFGNKPDTKWSKTNNGYVAFFTGNNRNTYVYFSNNGAIQYTNHRYAEDQLPKDVRHIVKSNFYDYAIVQVLEVQKRDFVGYLVQVQDKSTVKTIRVVGDEWEVVEEMNRQKK